MVPGHGKTRTPARGRGSVAALEIDAATGPLVPASMLAMRALACVSAPASTGVPAWAAQAANKLTEAANHENAVRKGTIIMGTFG